MKILKSFIASYKDNFIEKDPIFDESLLGIIKQSEYVLLDDKMSASVELEEEIKKMKKRAKEPMKVAVTGQFSSGKSTFLNAILSKSILPTGITPVTSKVNYIKYGDELKICIRYKDGRDEYQSIENIAKFTDQRQEVEDIEYLTIFSPLEMLKEINFVDTPGLNSQSNEDTKTTQKVLKDVDGIIWLSLIDNAGKLSEEKVLSKYLDEYQNKSLCVLNQKDKFSQEQVRQTLEYIQSRFSEYFSEIIPISAKQALDSRVHDKSLLVDNELDSFLKKLTMQLKSFNTGNAQELIKEHYLDYQRKTRKILDSDLSDNLDKLQESNIELVLDFINLKIRPMANSSKEYALKKDLTEIFEKLIQQHESFLTIYDELDKELSEFEQEYKERFAELKQRFSKKLKNAYSQIQEIVDTISNEIFTHISDEKRFRYSKQKKGLFKNKELYDAIEYKVSKIDSNLIYKYLFYDDNIVQKMFKKYVKKLKQIQDEVNENNALVYKLLKTRVRRWQSPYEFIRKSEVIHSDIEFANIRKFASKAYENILKAYSEEIHMSYARISSEFNHLSSAVSFNYENATKVSVGYLQKRIEDSIKLYEQSPTKFSLYQPSLKDIKEKLHQSFYLYELENMMNTKNTFMSKNYDRLFNEFDKISKEKHSLIQNRKQRHLKTIDILNKHLKII